MKGSFGSAELGSNEFLVPYGIPTGIKTVKETIFGMLSRDARLDRPNGLGNLLGHTDNPPYGIFFLNPPEIPDFPMVTYYAIGESGRPQRVMLVSTTVWGGNVDAIRDRIHRLLHGLKFTDVETTQVLDCKWNWASPNLFDRELNEHVGVDRYLIRSVEL